MSTRFPLMALGHGCDLQPEAPAAGIDADTHREVGMGRLIVSAAAHAQPGRFRFQARCRDVSCNVEQLPFNAQPPPKYLVRLARAAWRGGTALANGLDSAGPRGPRKEAIDEPRPTIWIEERLHQAQSWLRG